MEEKIKALREQIQAAIADVKSRPELDAFWQSYLSKKGSIAELMKGLRDVAKEDRPAVGALINELKTEVQAGYDEKAAKLEELELAYAITIHKSQGSEYPAVIMPLLTGPQMLFNRNLLYTGVTRAKKCVTIIGSPDTVAKMIENSNYVYRFKVVEIYQKIKKR